MQEKEEQDEEGSEKKVALQCNTWQHSAVRRGWKSWKTYLWEDGGKVVLPVSHCGSLTWQCRQLPLRHTNSSTSTSVEGHDMQHGMHAHALLLLPGSSCAGQGRASHLHKVAP